MNSKMKISAAVILSAVMLCACGGTSDSPAATSENTVSETETVSEVISEAAEKPSETTENQTEETEKATETESEKAEKEQLLYTFDDNSKVYDIIIDADGTYSFRHSGNDDVPWNVYILDEKFSDGYRYLYSNYTPSGVTEFTSDLKSGQYVYFICTENEWTESDGDFADTSVSVYLKKQ